MRNGKCDGVNSMKSSTLVVGPRVPVPIAFAASAHRGSLRNHPAEPLPQNEHPIPRELSGSMSTSCGRPPLVSRTASQGRSSRLPLASLLARAAVLARSVSKSARNQLWGRRNPRAKALTCGFVVARGGVEPPTFRFSDVRIHAGQKAARAIRAITRAITTFKETSVAWPHRRPWRGLTAPWQSPDRALQPSACSAARPLTMNDPTAS